MLDTEMDKGPLAELVILYKSGFQDKHFISYFSIKKIIIIKTNIFSAISFKSFHQDDPTDSLQHVFFQEKLEKYQILS